MVDFMFRMLCNSQSFPVFYLFREVWRYAVGRRHLLSLYVALSILAAGIKALEPMLLGVFFASFGLGGSGEHGPLFYLTLYVLIDLTFWIFHGPSRIIERELAQHVVLNFKLKLFTSATSFPLSWHQEQHSGELIEQVKRASDALGDFNDRSFETIQIFSKYFAALIGLGIFMPGISLIVACVSIVVFLSVTLFDRQLLSLEKQLNRLAAKVSGALQDYLSNITTVITLRLESRAESEVRRRLSEMLPVFQSRIRINESKWFLNNMLVSLMIAGMVYWYCITHMQNSQVVNVAALISLFEYLRRVADSFFSMGWKLGDLVTAAARVRIGERIVDEAKALGVRQHGQRLPENWKELELNGITFWHSGKEDGPATLDDVSIRLQRGKSVAIIGESGCGKSTLLTLLRRLRVAESSIVKCDGQEIDNGLEKISETATLVPQEPEIFADTIRYNVTLGVEASDAEILEAIRRARFDSVLARLPNGLATNIAEKGVNLSGGQKQRLALARAIFFAKDSEILLLDESTSSVDSVNEREIFRELFSQFSDRVIVATIHKLHLLPRFDYIYLLDHGRVVEEGSYSALVSRNGVVANLLKNYADEKEEEQG